MEKKGESLSCSEPDSNNDHEYNLIPLESNSNMLDSLAKLISCAFNSGENRE